jgi:hypothetical protein
MVIKKVKNFIRDQAVVGGERKFHVRAICHYVLFFANLFLT